MRENGRQDQMISVLIYCHDKYNTEEIHDLCNMNNALLGNEHLTVLKYSGEASPAEAVSKENITIDLIFYEILSETDVEELKKIRMLYATAEIMVIAPASVPTESYLIPDIRPIMFLEESSDETTKKQQIHDFFVFFHEKRMRDHSADKLIIDTRKEKRYLNYNQIVCMEACEKKIKVYYNQEQLSFYGSLKELETKLPSNFIRCHRSFIVNSIYISRMNLAQNNLLLEENLVIPISRKYKNELVHTLSKGKINRNPNESQG